MCFSCLNLFQLKHFCFSLRQLVILLCVLPAFADEIHVLCTKTLEENECSINKFYFPSDERKINYLTNTEQFRSEINDIVTSESRLVQVPADIFTAYLNLQGLFLQNCAINKIGEKTFQNAKNLLVLDLSKNKITELENTTFEGAGNLQSLDLSFNEIETVPRALFDKIIELKIVYLANNKIKKINKSTFSRLTNLRQLNLDNNQIKTIDSTIFRNNKKMQILQLSNNKISDVGESIKNLNKLWQLDLSRNSLKKLENYPKSVLNLFVNENRLENLFINENVNKLNATKNQISEMDFYSYIALKELYLNDNRLGNIEKLSKLKNIEILHIASNPLHQISNGFFGKNRVLRELNVLNTRISVDCRNFGTSNQLERLYFNGFVNLDYFNCFEDGNEIVFLNS